MQQNLFAAEQQQSFEQQVIRRINKEIQQEQLNRDSRIILLPPTNQNYHTLRAFYIIKEDQFQNYQSSDRSDRLRDQANGDSHSKNSNFQSGSKKEKYVYSNCVLEVNVIIPKTYPHTQPRFKFPQQPLHPSFKNDGICCGISCQFKKNWDPTQTIFSGIETFCRSILSIPCVLNGDRKIDLTRDCNFEIINLINNNKQTFLDRCEKWASTKGSLLQYANDVDFCSFVNKNANNPLVQEVQQKIQQIKDRRTAFQLRMLEKNAVYFQSLSLSMMQQIISQTQKADLLSSFNQQQSQQQQQQSFKEKQLQGISSKSEEK